MSEQFKATHKIVDTTGEGGEDILVMAFPGSDGPEEGYLLYTKLEWEVECDVDYTMDADGSLQFQGQPACLLGKKLVKLSPPSLHDYRSGDFIRVASPAELKASKEAAEHDGGAGVIEVDGRACYVVD